MIYKFSIVVGGTLKKFSSESKNLIMSDVMTYFKENNINFNMKDLSSQIDLQSRPFNKSKKTITLAEAATGAMAVIKYGAGSSVSDNELLRRSAICEACPMADRIGGCQSCGAAGAIAKFANNIRSKLRMQSAIPNSVKSSYCGICGCSLALMVVTKIDNFKEESPTENQKRPDNCWLKTTSPNFAKE
jgi:hypothetical protein